MNAEYRAPACVALYLVFTCKFKAQFAICIDFSFLSYIRTKWYAALTVSGTLTRSNGNNTLSIQLFPRVLKQKKSCCSVRWFREYKQWPEEIEWNIHSKPTIKEKTILADWNLCVWVLGMKMFCNQKPHTGFNETVWEHKQSLYFDRTLGVNTPFNSSRVSWVYSGLNLCWRSSDLSEMEIIDTWGDIRIKSLIRIFLFLFFFLFFSTSREILTSLGTIQWLPVVFF